MQVTYTVGPYNARRYGRPWLARITAWPVGAKPTHIFGATVGGHTAEIDAPSGAVVRYGQKDTRRPDRSAREWGIVQEDGTIERVTESVARAAARAESAL